MKIVHVVPYFQPSYGYEEFYHALNHAKLGGNVTVITSKYYHPNLVGNTKKIVLPDDDLNLPFNIIRLNSLEIGYGAQNILIGLNKALLKLEPDALYLHGPECLTYCFIKSIIKINCKTLIDVHKDGGKNFKKRGITTKIVEIIKNKIISFNLKGCRHILFFSKNHMNDYFHKSILYFKNSSLFTPMPVDVSAFKRNELIRENFRENNALKDSDILVVITGRLTKEKNILETLITLNRINNDNLYIRVAGDITVDYLNIIKNSCFNLITEGRLHFLPKLSNIKLSELYNASDFALWPHHMSVGILEALSCGANVVTNSISKDYYPSIPDYGIIEGDLETCFKKIICEFHKLSPLQKYNKREMNSQAVSDLTYENLASFTMQLFNKP